MKLFIPKRMAAALTVSGLVTATACGGALAQTFPSFTVNEAFVPGANPATVTADKITGNYNEVITFSGNTFQAALLWNAGQFTTNNGRTAVNSQLGAFFPNQYGLYGLFQGNGTFSTVGGVTNFNFSPGGSLRIFLDPNSNTTFTAPGTGSSPFTTGNSTDDIQLATGTPSSGQGTLDPSLPTCAGGTGSGINCGNFGASSSFTLTAAGSSYFTSPIPFYNVSFQSGQLNNFSATGTQRINGSLDVIFQSPGGGPSGGPVPEPGTVALFALGILGWGITVRLGKR